MTDQYTSTTKHNDQAQCDLYPIIPSTADICKSLSHLEKIISYNSVTAVRLDISAPVPTSTITTLTDLLYHHNVALMVAPTQIDLLNTLPLDRIDGVHLTHIKDIKSIPTIYHKKRLSLQTGCSCTTLDDAMRAGEQGVDYVAFRATETTAITQWSLVTELPCVADAVTSIEQAQHARHAGADFLGVLLKLDASDYDFLTALDALVS